MSFLNRLTLRSVCFGILKFAAVYLAVQLLFLVLTQLVPDGRQRLETSMIVTTILAEAWAFAPTRKPQFSLKSLLLVTTLACLVLGMVRFITTR